MNEKIKELYNKHVQKLAKAMDMMDSNNKKISKRGDERFAAELAAIEAISDVVTIIGWQIITDDGEGGIAIDVKEKE